MTLSNRLTIMRLICALVFIGVFFFDTFATYLIAWAIAIFSEVTDYLDGSIARKRGEITDFGKLMDPFADSMTRFSFFICFYDSGVLFDLDKANWNKSVEFKLATIMIILIFYRDAGNLMLRVLAMSKKIVIAARKSGKIKAGIQAVGIQVLFICLILRKMVDRNYFGLGESGFLDNLIPQISFYTMVVITIYTVYSAFDYWFSNKHIVAAVEK
ncbi:MAG: CDP-alcohol phosphatidyltransferase family protein [Fibrobacterota bacterium]